MYWLTNIVLSPITRYLTHLWVSVRGYFVPKDGPLQRLIDIYEEGEEDMDVYQAQQWLAY
ncbi:hypothetical protein PMIN06_011944 [Paraphaeosphaeria minitans]